MRVQQFQLSFFYAKRTEEIAQNQTSVKIWNILGLIFKLIGNYDVALDYYQKSLKIRQEIGDRQGEGVTLNNISQIS